MLRKCLLTLGLVLTLGVFATNNAAMAGDSNFCAKYAIQAEKAVSLAKHLKCGFQGPRWIKEKGAHMAWCILVDPNLAHSESDARAAELKQCTCSWYADHTMVQIAMNIANKCGFSGLRWLESKQAHYDWCFNMNPPFSAMENEIDIRKKMLNGC